MNFEKETKRKITSTRVIVMSSECVVVVTLRRAHTPTTSTSTTRPYCGYFRSPRNSLATRAQFQIHCVSVLHINRLTELLWRTLTRRSLKSVNSMTVSSQLSTHTDALATSTHWHRCNCTRPTVSHKTISHRPRFTTSRRTKKTNCETAVVTVDPHSVIRDQKVNCYSRIQLTDR